MGVRWCSGQDAGSLSQRSRVQSRPGQNLLSVSARAPWVRLALYLRGRLNEYQSSTGKVTAGCGRVSVLPPTTLELDSLSAQDHLKRR